MHPDYSSPRLVFGGRLAGMPCPLVFYFDGDLSRKRRISVKSWVFTGWGVHYHADVREEDNRVWNGEAWCVPWAEHRDFESLVSVAYFFSIRGRSATERFDTPEEVRVWTDGILKDWGITEDTHVVEFELEE